MTLQKGQAAPPFTTNDQDGKSVSLTDFSGKKVVLYFYPKDDTPGCTAQSCNLRDNYERLKANGYEVIGISPDGEASHQKFQAKYSLPFTLLTDEDHGIQEAYGVWKEKNMYGRKYMGTVRTTFLIDSDGTISDIIKKVKTAEHTDQIIK